MTTKFIALITGVVLASAAVRAQEPQMRQLESLPPPATLSNRVPAAATVPVGEQADLAPVLVLQRRPPPPLFQAYSDSQFFFDSNLLLTPAFRLQDGVYFQTVGAAVSPRLADGLTSTVFARQQFLRYLDYSALDFDAQTVGAALSYPVRDWFTVYGSFAADRLYLRSNEIEFYKEFATEFGLWRSERLCTRAALYYGYQLDWLAARPAALAQIENALYAGLNVTLCPKLTGQVLYRFRLRDYEHNNRSDLDHLVGVALVYGICRNASVSAYANYGDNNSNFNQFNYRVLNAGGGLNLSVRF